MDSLLPESRISKTAVCGGKVCNINLFGQYWTKSDHKHLMGSHSLE